MQIGKETSGFTQPLWLDSVGRPDFPSIDTDINTNICIIGGGISGLTTAYCLAREGKRVVVLEDGKIGSGETGRTTAHLSNAFDDHYTEIEKLHGIEVAKLVAQSHTAAINFIENIIKHENIECDFLRLDGYLFTKTDSNSNLISEEYQAAQRAGVNHLSLGTTPPENIFPMAHYLCFGDQGQFHPIKYLNGLAKAITNYGGSIFENTHATQVTGGKSPCVRVNHGYEISADAIIVATNSPINNRYTMHTKQVANRTYVIVGTIPKNSLKTALYWDTAEPYHYIRLQKCDKNLSENFGDCDLLIIGGEDHRTGSMLDTHMPFKCLEAWARVNFPQIQRFTHQWSGQILEPLDYLGFIGNSPLDTENIFIVTGDSGNGMTHGTIASILITDLIMGRHQVWKDIYDPSRKPMKKINEFFKHNLETSLTYLNYLTQGTIPEIHQLKPGCAALIKQGLKKIAAYRDHDGKLYTCSAICPHLKSIVQWNSAERTWDCPAHGSRFSFTGEVINGPAYVDLTRIDNKE